MQRVCAIGARCKEDSIEGVIYLVELPMLECLTVAIDFV